MQLINPQGLIKLSFRIGIYANTMKLKEKEK